MQHMFYFFQSMRFFIHFVPNSHHLLLPVWKRSLTAFLRYDYCFNQSSPSYLPTSFIRPPSLLINVACMGCCIEQIAFEMFVYLAPHDELEVTLQCTDQISCASQSFIPIFFKRPDSSFQAMQIFLTHACRPMSPVA